MYNYALRPPFPLSRPFHPPPSPHSDAPSTLTLSPERQSARVSKITNDGLTRPGIGCFIAVPIWQQ